MLSFSSIVVLCTHTEADKRIVVLLQAQAPTQARQVATALKLMEVLEVPRLDRPQEVKVLPLS